MKKFKISVTLESSETKKIIETEAIIEKNIIKYKENDNTYVTLNTKDNILIRENEKLLMQFKFAKGETLENSLFIKDLNQTMNIIIKTENIICKNKYYKVEYEIIDNDKFNYAVKVGEKNECD